MGARHIGMARKAVALLVIGPAALVVLVAMSGCGSGPTHSAPEKLYETGDGGRAWHRISTSTTDVGVASVRRCAPVRTHVASIGGGEAMTHVDLVLKFVNASRTSCRVSGWPRLYGLRGARRVPAGHTRIDAALRHSKITGLQAGGFPSCAGLSVTPFVPARAMAAI